MTCGLSAASSVMVTAPLRGPVAVGLNFTLIVQLAPGATLPPQVCVREKSPLATMLEIARFVVPVFCNVMVCAALVVPTVCGPNFRLEEESLAIEFVPLPERFTDCGDPPALSVIVNLPVRLPVAVGVKVT